MKEIQLDYIFSTSPNLLFKRLSTASGLNEWFADNVSVNKNIFTFNWQDFTQKALIRKDNKNLSVRFDWLDTDDTKYLKFEIKRSPLSKDITLFITDFIDDDETKEDAKKLWDNIIKRLKRRLGLT